MNFLNKLYRKIKEEINILIINVYKFFSIFSFKKIIDKKLIKTVQF